jgi:phytoene dehydrogenase-like protein
MTETQNWDVICVGSGITSLAFASEILRLHPHLKVLVLEKHSVAGGYASEFLRPKLNSRFDCSLHKLSGMGANGNLRRTLVEMGIENSLDLHYEEVLFEASTAGSTFSVSSAPDQAQLDLIKEFPAEEAGIRAFFRDVETHGRNLYMQFRTLLGDFTPDMEQLRYAHKNLKQLSVLDGIRQHVSDPRLLEMLALPVLYIGGYPEEVSYPYFLHIVYACQFMQCAYVKGGSQHLSNALVDKIREQHGTVLLSTRVDQIILDESHELAIGVRSKERVFYGKHIVVNSAPDYAVNNLFGEAPGFDEIRETLDKLIPANSTTTAYIVTDVPPQTLGLDAGETWLVSDQVHELPQMRTLARDIPGDADLAERAYWEHSTIEVTNYQLLDSTGGNVILINTLDDIRHWPRRKTQEYREKKKKALSVLLERLYLHKPSLRGHVIYQEISSPHTYVRYTNNTNGSGYGARVTTHQSGHGFQYKFPVRNVSFMSAWVAGSGYEAGIGYASLKAKGFHHFYSGA